MSFMDDLEAKALPVRQAILRHPFVTGIGDGTLDVDKFKFYVRQDYLYLIDYSRVVALAAARSPERTAPSMPGASAVCSPANQTLPAGWRTAARRSATRPGGQAAYAPPAKGSDPQACRAR